MMAYEGIYHDPSDADDEFERERGSTFMSPTLPADYESSPTESDPPSTENTPTTYTHSTVNAVSPRGLITSWSEGQCADFVASLGLDRYKHALIDHGINGQALVEVQQTDLKDLGIMSVGHRLTILKGVYEVKLRQNIRIESDDYVPLSADANAPDSHATIDDVKRIINQIRLRDDRIKEAETEIRQMRDDIYRLEGEQRKLREETLPMIRMAKDKTQALPTPNGVDSYHNPLNSSPDLNNQQQPTSNEPPKSAGSGTITRKYSNPTKPKKNIFGGNNTKMPSPTIREESSNLDPSAAARAASAHLTNSFHSSNAAQSSPSLSQQPSPTSPPYSIQNLGRSDRSTYSTISALPDRGQPTTAPTSSTTRKPVGGTSASSISTAAAIATPPTSNGNIASTPNPNSDSSAGGGGDPGDPNGFMKSFRVSMEEPCHKVLPVALKKYRIADDWRQYSLYIVHGDQERCLGLEERPLILFKQLANEGKKPMFMLRKHAAPQDGWASTRADLGNGGGGGVGALGGGGGGGGYGGDRGGGGAGVNGASGTNGGGAGGGSSNGLYWGSGGSGGSTSNLNLPGSTGIGVGREGRVQSYMSGQSSMNCPGGVL